MTAAIYLDPAAVHPVIDGEWHRLKNCAMPQSGETATMLCGVTAVVEYGPLEQRRRDRPPTCCPDCDARYRRKHGIPPPRGTR